MRVEYRAVRVLQALWVDAQHAVTCETRMHMYVQMRNLLTASLANGVPQAQPLIWKRGAHCPGDARDHGHERRAGSIIQLTNILKVPTGNDDHVAGMELPQIHDCHRHVVLADDAGRGFALCDLAKDACMKHGTSPHIKRSSQAGPSAWLCRAAPRASPAACSAASWPA